MKIFNYLICVIFIFIQFSCSTSSELGTKMDKFFQSKRYRLAVNERDSLIAVNRLLQTDTIRMTNLIKSLQSEHQKLSKVHLMMMNKDSALTNENFALKQEQIKLKADYKHYSDSLEKQLSQLTQELKAKSEEINNNEKLLNDDQSQKALRDSVVSELDNSIKNAYEGFSPDELTTVMLDGKIYLSIADKLLFKPGSASIEDKGRKALKKLSQVINRSKDIDVRIEVNADKTPIKSTLYKDNWDFSVAKATMIVRILSDEYDVDPSKLTASGRGKFFSLAANENVEGKAKGKRIDIILTPGFSQKKSLKTDAYD